MSLLRVFVPRPPSNRAIRPSRSGITSRERCLPARREAGVSILIRDNVRGAPHDAAPELCGATRSRLENFPANLAPPLPQPCAERNKVRARSTPKQPASLRQTTWFGNVLCCAGSARRKSSREISAQGGTALQLHRLLTRGFAVDPCFEGVTARRKAAQSKSAAFIGNNEVWRV